MKVLLVLLAICATMLLACGGGGRKQSDTSSEATTRATKSAKTPTANKGEPEFDGLVLMWSKTEGKHTRFGAEITGEVINRRGRKLAYVQITFGLYDKDGKLVDTAIANVNGLESDGTWKFKASSFRSGDWDTFKVNELSGY